MLRAMILGKSDRFEEAGCRKFLIWGTFPNEWLA
jgi:hypothetical protein